VKKTKEQSIAELKEYYAIKERMRSGERVPREDFLKVKKRDMRSNFHRPKGFSPTRLWPRVIGGGFTP